MGIKLLNSSPYYAQANGQAKTANKGVIKLIKRKIDENPRRWHTILFLARAMCKSLDVAEVELVVCEEQLNNGL